MSPYQKHLYAIMYPTSSLVASQLEPTEFAASYAIGSARFYRGKMLFFEVDRDFRDPYFDIEHYLALTEEHPDGRPKRTKFISSYRVLEHLRFGALRGLFAVAVSGRVLPLPRADLPEVEGHRPLRIYQMLNPSGLIYATKMSPPAFSRYVTAAGYPKGSPAVFFTEYAVDVEHFSDAWDRNPFISSPIDGLHPRQLKQVLDSLALAPEDAVRSVGLRSAFAESSYRQIAHGFWVGRGKEQVFFRMPSPQQLRDEHEAWLNSIA